MKQKITACILICIGFSLASNAQVSVTNLSPGITPQSLFHVHSNSVSGQILQLTNTTSGYTASTYGFAIKLDPNFKTIFANQYNNANASIAFTTNTGTDVERLTIKNNGCVGIGESNPAHKLSIAGQLGLLETGPTPIYYTALHSGNLSTNLLFTLPASYGTAGQSLTTDGTGNLSWQNNEVPLAFSNGLRRSGSAVKLGGTLSENTTITQSGTSEFTFTNGGTSNTVFNLAGSAYLDLLGYGSRFLRVFPTGEFDYTYPGDLNCLSVNGSTPYALAYFANNYPSDTYGLSAGCFNSLAGSNSYGIVGFNQGAGYGVYSSSVNGTGCYGKNSNLNNFGYLGSLDYGVFGQYNGSGNYGYLGSSAYGVFGINTTSNNYGYIGGVTSGVLGAGQSGNTGYLGSSNYGVYGINATSGNYAYLGGSLYGIYTSLGSSATAPGTYGIYAYGIHTDGVDGTSYGVNGTLGAIEGYNFYGNPYTFAVSGYTYLDYNRSGAVFGGFYNGGAPWGSIAYKTSGNINYGGYFTSTTTGTGKSPAGTKTNSGIGAWGELFGADIHGEVYGAYMEGSDYGSFVHGDSYLTGLDVHLQKEENGKTVPLYTNVSTDVSVQTYGYANLSGGFCEVKFEESFTASVSKNSPVIVTVTPMGNTGGVYLSEVTSEGFKVVENDNRKSSVQFSYIAIGKRAGYEQPSLPQDVVSSDYVDRVSAGLHNDADMTTNGQGLYYENGRLTVGIHPSTLPDPNKPAVDPRAEKVASPEIPKISKPVEVKPIDGGNGKAPGKNGLKQS